MSICGLGISNQWAKKGCKRPGKGCVKRISAVKGIAGGLYEAY
jgi:hypothetical protein